MATNQQFTATGRPPMIGQCLTLQEWLAYIEGYELPVSCTRLVLHHTYVPNQAQWNGINSMRGMQRYYAGLGWSAAPHIYVAPDGIWLFTPLDTVGVHAGKGNSGNTNGAFWYSIGLEMVGDFDKVRPSGAVWEQTKAVIGSISRKTGIEPRKLVSFHRDYTNEKSCPGWAITKEWVWGEVEAWLKQTQEKKMYHVIATVAPIYEAPSILAPIAWSGKAVMGHGNTFEGIDQNNGFVWHTGGIGFVEKSRISLENATTFTEYDSIFGFPSASFDTVCKFILNRGSAYVPFDVKVIVGHMFDIATPVNVDPIVVAAQSIHETSDQADDDPELEPFSSYWALRPRRNSAGIGVTGAPGAGVSFPSWKDSIEAQVGRLLRYFLKIGEGTAEQIALMETALKWRDLDMRAWGSCRHVKHLGAIHNPANAGLPRERWVAGWAWDGKEYGKRIADLVNAIRNT